MIKGLEKYTIIFIFLFSALFPSYLHGQKRIKLPSELNENSGLVFLSSDSCLWINDSGNDADVIKSDLKGRHIKHHFLKIKNIDWEDLTYDDSGNIFIADIGDNAERRKYYKIYKLNKDLNLVDSIIFEYEMAPNHHDISFDAEAIVYWNGKLHIFTKGNAKRKEFMSHHFVIETNSSNQIAKYIETIDLKGFLFTGAALSPDHRTMAMSTYRYKFIFGFLPDTDSRIYYFDASASGPNILSKPKGSCLIPTWFITRQYESIDYLDEHNILLAAEKTSFLRPLIRKIKIPNKMR